MLIFNPTYSALPESLHCKLTFLFFSLPLPPLLPSLSLSCSRPFPFSSPVILPLQQTYSRENYWRWGVWEKQELLPGAGRAAHGRHESAERCSTEPFSLSFIAFFLSVSHSHTLSVSFFSLFVASVSPQAFLSLLCPLPLPDLLLCCPIWCPIHPLLPSPFTPLCTWESFFS